MNAKQAAAEKAVEYIENGMVVGLGTGSTAYWAIQKLGQRVQEGLTIRAIPSSAASADQARGLGIPLVSFAEVEKIDVDIDGADEVDAARNLIKGGGGALLREKILAYNSRSFLVIVDESKFSVQLGRHPLPVEVLPFAHEMAMRNLALLGCEPLLRIRNQQVYVTENGNLVVDCQFEAITDPEKLLQSIRSIPGVMDAGLFPGRMVKKVFIGFENGTVREL